MENIKIVEPVTKSLPYLIRKDLPKIEKVFLLSDSNVYPIYGIRIKNLLEKDGFKVSNYVVEAGENNKTLESAERIWKFLFLSKADKKTLFLNLGGGVISDLGGFVASTYYRGIPLINIPTTLLSMVDAAIGGKNGVNTSFAKNSIGSFYLPKQVYIDPSLLSSLEQREMSNGLAEVIKYGFIKSPQILADLETRGKQAVEYNPDFLKEVIERCTTIKSQIVQSDLWDTKGERALLNFGHTFAHAIETESQYKLLSHGQAVSIGICCAIELSIDLGYCEHHLLERAEQLLSDCQLPITLPNFNIGKLINLMKADKKAEQNKVSAIILKREGEAFLLKNIPDSFIEKTLTTRMANQSCLV
ncbi:MAG: 3-dehydroquinate synthase [Chlamydiales bacterium]|nr:3-dehydroquinate synthase [Chlamydiales bacterium]